MRPVMTKIPSEHSIEVLANHFLLNAINNPRAWLYCPTTNEESRLGFDASLQNTKLAVIQYKRAKRFLAGGDVRVTIDPGQLSILHTRFVRMPTPYVFYGFSLLPSYAAMQRNFRAAPPQTFFDSCIFVDAHSIPAGSTVIKEDRTNFFATASGRTDTPVVSFPGQIFAAGICQCNIGTCTDKLSEQETNRDAGPLNIRATTLYYPL